MQHYWHGRSLAELHQDPPTLSLLELRRFLRFLPPESATARALYPRSKADAEREYWSGPADRFFAATLIDCLRENTFVQVKLNADPKKTRHLKPPKPIPRPGVEPKDTKVIRFGGRHGSGQLTEVFGQPAQTS
ncbi:hypothetical protein OG216_09610 [Streptomycetaceae bacterium NBC_01309]